MDVRQAHERRDQLQLVDVREPEEWQAGRIEEAMHIAMGEIPDRVAELDRDRTIVAVCRSGARSGKVAEWLRQQGFDAHNLDGGMQAWAEANLPFTAPDGSPGRVV